MTILPQTPPISHAPFRPPLLMLPAPSQPKLLCAPKIAGLLPARAALPTIEIIPPESEWIKRPTRKELEEVFGDRLILYDEIIEELQANGVDIPLIESVSGPIEIIPPESEWIKRPTRKELEAIIGGPLRSREQWDAELIEQLQQAGIDDAEAIVKGKSGERQP